MPRKPRRIGKRHGHVLKLLAAQPHGRAEPTFIASYTPELVDLVRLGLATAERATMQVQGQPTETARITITRAGQVMIQGPLRISWH